MHRYEPIYAVVRRIPRGRVATYGQIAKLAGLGRRARLVGYALGCLPDGVRVPWHRVVNSQGAISPRDYPDAVERQRAALMAEGVFVAPSGRVPLTKYRWRSGL